MESQDAAAEVERIRRISPATGALLVAAENRERRRTTVALCLRIRMAGLRRSMQGAWPLRAVAKLATTVHGGKQELPCVDWQATVAILSIPLFIFEITFYFPWKLKNLPKQEMCSTKIPTTVLLGLNSYFERNVMNLTKTL
jgi:hypothetical protein